MPTSENSTNESRSETVSFYVTKSVKEQLKSTASDKGKSLSALLRDYTAQLLEQDQAGGDTGGQTQPIVDGETDSFDTIAEILLVGGPILQDELATYLDNDLFTNHEFAQQLLKLSCPSSVELGSFLRGEFEVPELNLDHHELLPEVIDLVPEETVTTYGVLPVAQVGPVLFLTQVPPFETEPFQNLRRETGLKTCPVRCEEPQIRDAIREYYGLTVEEIDEALRHRSDRLSGKDERAVDEAVPVSRPLREILEREMERDLADEWHSLNRKDEPVEPIPAPDVSGDA